MSWDVLINKTVGSFMLPPGINLLLFVLGFLLIRKYRLFSTLCFLAAFLSLCVFSLPWFANKLIITLETEPAISLYQLKEYHAESADAYSINETNDTKKVKRAIVVLAGSRIPQAPEYGDIDTVGETTLARIRYASWLAKKTKLPVLLSGGSVFDQATPLSVLMNQVIISHFSVAPQWVETQSKNTAENAIHSAEILKKHGVEEILLVTHAWHMPRAKRCFQNQKIKVISAPMGFRSNKTDLDRFDRFLPSAHALMTSNWAMHEIIGRYWYELRYSY